MLPQYDFAASFHKKLLPAAIEPLPDYFNGKTGIAEHRYLHIRGIPVDDLAQEPIVLEITW